MYTLKNIRQLTNLYFFVEYPKGHINSYEGFYRKVLELPGFIPDKDILVKIVNYVKKRDVFRLYPNVKFIKGLNVHKAILTTTPIFRFNYLPLDEFDPIFTGKEIGRAKPHPNGWLKILNIWKLRPSEVLMVGDEVDGDIILARKLGIKTAFISREGQKCDKADYNISSLKEILEILGNEYASE